MHTTGPHESPHTFVPAPTVPEDPHAMKDKAGEESGGVRETGEEGPQHTGKEEKQQERPPTLVGSKEQAVSIEEKGEEATAKVISDVPKSLAASFASSRPASVYRLRTSSQYSSSRLRGLSSFWIKGVYMLSIVATVLVCLPLLRLSFSALGTQGLAGVFFLQGWALIGMVMYPFLHTFHMEQPYSKTTLTAIFAVLGALTAVMNGLTALTAYKDPLAGQPVTWQYVSSNAIYFGLYEFGVILMALMYRRQSRLTGWCLYTATLPIYIYTLSAVQILRFTQGRVDLWSYSFLVPLFLVATYWMDRGRMRAGVLTLDSGYLLLVVLFSNGASVSIGGFMLTWLMKVSEMPDVYTLLLSIAWSCTAFVFWLMWRHSAIAASNRHLYPPLMFALQLTIELYSELIFLGLSLRSAVWWLMVLTEAAVVLLKDSGVAMHLYRRGMENRAARQEALRQAAVEEGQESKAGENTAAAALGTQGSGKTTASSRTAFSMRRLNSEHTLTVATAIMAMALGKNQALLDMADNKSGRVVHEDEEEEEKQKEEEENAVALLESQRDVCELATTVTVLLLFPLEALLDRLWPRTRPSLSLGYTSKEKADITGGYGIICVFFLLSRMASRRLADWLRVGTPEEMARKRRARERADREHWVTHMWYFVAVTVFVVSDCLFRLIELRLAIDVKRVRDFKPGESACRTLRSDYTSSMSVAQQGNGAKSAGSEGATHVSDKTTRSDRVGLSAPSSDDKLRSLVRYFVSFHETGYNLPPWGDRFTDLCIDAEYLLAEEDIYVDSNDKEFRARLRTIVDAVFEEEHVKASLERHARINSICPHELPDHIFPRRRATTARVEDAGQKTPEN